MLNNYYFFKGNLEQSKKRAICEIIDATSYNLIGKYHEVFDLKFDTFQFMVWHKTNPIFKIAFLKADAIFCVHSSSIMS